MDAVGALDATSRPATPVEAQAPLPPLPPLPAPAHVEADSSLFELLPPATPPSATGFWGAQGEEAAWLGAGLFGGGGEKRSLAPADADALPPPPKRLRTVSGASNGEVSAFLSSLFAHDDDRGATDRRAAVAAPQGTPRAPSLSPPPPLLALSSPPPPPLELPPSSSSSSSLDPPISPSLSLLSTPPPPAHYPPPPQLKLEPLDDCAAPHHHHRWAAPPQAAKKASHAAASAAPAPATPGAWPRTPFTFTVCVPPNENNDRVAKPLSSLVATCGVHRVTVRSVTVRTRYGLRAAHTKSNTDIGRLFPNLARPNAKIGLGVEAAAETDQPGVKLVFRSVTANGKGRKELAADGHALLVQWKRSAGKGQPDTDAVFSVHALVNGESVPVDRLEARDRDGRLLRGWIQQQNVADAREGSQVVG